MDDLKYWVAFSRIPSIGTVRMRLLEAAFPSIRDAWEAPASALKAAGLTASVLQQVTSRRSAIDPDAEMVQLERAGVRAVKIYDPPPVLFFKGGFTREDVSGVAVVGTRRASAYGREACASLVRDLAVAGVTIISGLARGIDAIAHTTALESGGRTIAVMGTGVDVIYPADHKQLAARVAEHGALVSEYPLGVRPDSRNFPRRNRLLSGPVAGRARRRGADGQRRHAHGAVRAGPGPRRLCGARQHLLAHQPSARTAWCRTAPSWSPTPPTS